MDPVSAVAIIGVITTVVNNIATQIIAIKQLHDQIKGAGTILMSLVAQLNSIKAALNQIQVVIETAGYDEQLQLDLGLSVQASQLHVDYIDGKISNPKTKNAATTLKFRSKVKVVFESEDMSACLERLKHQATALNLLIIVLTSKSVTEQRAMLQRSNTRKVFKQIQEDKASLLDEAVSICVLRDEESVRNAAVRTKSEPVITKSPWKRFSFDPDVLGSRPYGAKLFRRRKSEKDVLTEELEQVDTETIDDAITLVEEPVALARQTTEFGSEENEYGRNNSRPARFSKMLAFGHSEYRVFNLIRHAQRLWNAPDTPSTLSLAPNGTMQTYTLRTRYFDLRVYSCIFTRGCPKGVNEALLASYRDVSSILFVANLSPYDFDSARLENDLTLFARVSNDYHLWLAKIILFLDVAGIVLSEREVWLMM